MSEDRTADAHAFISALQAQGGPAADALAATLSFLGDELFYLLLIPVVYWVFSTRQALRLAAFVLLSTWLNGALKWAWDTPRPDAGLVEIADESVPPGGIPSGHAQNAVVTWGFLAWVGARRLRFWVPGWTVWTAAALMALGIGLSRLYRGVHFPVDVLVGWAIGLGLLAGGLHLLPRLEGWLAERPMGVRLALAGGVPALLLVLFRQDLALPAAAALGGVWVGAVLAEGVFTFRPASGGWAVRLGRTALGIPGAGAIWVGGPVLLGGLGTWGDLAVYVALGLWVSLGAPLLFRVSGLARGVHEHASS